jgi:hypothetical protein
MGTRSWGSSWGGGFGCQCYAWRERHQTLSSEFTFRSWSCCCWVTWECHVGELMVFIWLAGWQRIHFGSLKRFSLSFLITFSPRTFPTTTALTYPAKYSWMLPLAGIETRRRRQISNEKLSPLHVNIFPMFSLGLNEELHKKSLTTFRGPSNSPHTLHTANCGCCILRSTVGRWGSFQAAVPDQPILLDRTIDLDLKFRSE